MTEHRLSLTALAQSLVDGAHSIFSASGSGLWFHCAGALLPNVLAPDDAKIEAVEGTVAHGVGELWLRTKRKPTHLIGTVETVIENGVTYQIEIGPDMLNYLEEYYSMCAWLPGQHFIETKVYYSEITPIPKQGGTADFVACTWQRMVIIDLKYGKGHQVHPEGNTQALLYALGFFYEYDWLYDFQEIEIRICQPRMEPTEPWIITREYLLEFSEKARVRAHMAWDVNAERTPGLKQCQFCKVKASCAAHYLWQAEMTSGAWLDETAPVTVEQVQELKENIEFQQIVKLSDVYSLTTEEMAYLYRYRSMYESWWMSLHNQLAIRAAQGEKIPGMKLVEARSKRRIKDETYALKVLTEDLPDDQRLKREEIIKTTFISPSQLEKLLQKHGVRGEALKNLITPLVHKPTGKPTLAYDSDRRPAIVDISEEAFGNLELETDETDETEEL